MTSGVADRGLAVPIIAIIDHRKDSGTAGSDYGGIPCCAGTD